MKVKKGITRIIFIFQNYVIKLPNFTYSWNLFLTGLLANLNERNCWKYNVDNELLCPIIWMSIGGWILVMKKVDVKKHIEERKLDNINHFDYYIKWINSGFGGDDKPDNYGYLNEKLVKIDYA